MDEAHVLQSLPIVPPTLEACACLEAGGIRPFWAPALSDVTGPNSVTRVTPSSTIQPLVTYWLFHNIFMPVSLTHSKTTDQDHGLGSVGVVSVFLCSSARIGCPVVDIVL